MPENIVTEDGQATTVSDPGGGETREAGSSEPSSGTEARVLLRDLPEEMRGQKRGGVELKPVYAGDVLKRDITVNVEGVDVEARTVEIAFASDVEVDRYYYIEQLVVGKKNIRTGRIEAGLQVLFNHGRNEYLGIMIPKSFRVEGSICRGTLYMSKHEDARKILEDMADLVPGDDRGIIRHISFAYRVWKTEVVDMGGGLEKDRVTDWEPMEISIVTVPADYEKSGVARDVPEPESQEAQRADTTKERETMPPNTEVQNETDTRSGEVNVQQRESDSAGAELRRIQEIRDLGDRFDKRELANKFIDERKSADDFKDTLLREIGTPTTLEEEQGKTRLDLTRRDRESFSVSRLILSELTGKHEDAAFERECCAEVQARNDKAGLTTRGMPIPFDMIEHRDERVTRDAVNDVKRALGRRDVTYGGDAYGAALVGSEHRGDAYIDILRAASVLIANGARVMPGMKQNIVIPRKTSAAEFVIIAEGGTLTASDLQWLGLALQPWTNATKVAVSRRMLIQSIPAVDALIFEDIAEGDALKIDYLGLNGSGSGEPRGITNTANLGAISAGVPAVVTWDHIVALETECHAANVRAERLAYLAHSRMIGHLKQTEKFSGGGKAIMEGPTVNEYKVLRSNQLPTGVTVGGSDDCMPTLFGDIGDVIIPMWSGLDLVVDKTTRDDGGHIVKSYHDIDVGVRHGESFTLMEGARVG